MLKESISGVRGIVGEGLTPELILRYCAAFAKILGDGALLVARDSRPSGRAIAKLVNSALQLAGRDVVDIGVQATPTAEIAVKTLDCAGGIVITASHNPAEWNALKFIDNGGIFLDGKGFERLRSAMVNEPRWAKFDKVGGYILNEKAVEYHLDRILRLPFMDYEAIRARKFRVVLDANGGTGAIAALPLLEHLNCEIFELNCDPDGVFRHGAEPTPENLASLERAVVENSADIGLATDPDADRLALVDETGKAIGEEFTLALGVAEAIEHSPGTVVVNLSTSAMVESLGVPVIRTPVGEINVTKKMLELDSPAGGEGNGGLIIPACHPCRDGILAVAVVLNRLTRKGIPLTQAIEEFPKLTMIKTKISFDGTFDKEMTETILRALSPEKIDAADGIRLTWADKWVHVRASNTEPILRIIAEAENLCEAQKLVESVRSTLA